LRSLKLFTPAQITIADNATTGSGSRVSHQIKSAMVTITSVLKTNTSGPAPECAGVQSRGILVDVVAGVQHQFNPHPVPAPLLDLVEVAAVGVERTVGLLVEGSASNRASPQAIVTTRTKVAPERGRDRSRG
jgi:hypothetical protein